MELLTYILQSLASIIIEPYMIVILVILAIIFYTKNKRVCLIQNMIIGERMNSPMELTLSQIVMGLIAGIVASIVLTFLGVVFKDNSEIQYLFFISILLMFANPRFICFSYSGAILALVSLLLNNSGNTDIINIDILSLMTFIGVLHIIEGFLVMVDGSRGATPVFSNRNNKIIGGFSFNRNWAIPLTILIAFTAVSTDSVATQTIATPGWWPLIRNEDILNIINTLSISLISFVGVIGYSSISFTKCKKEKAVSSGIFILGYGFILCLVAQLTRFGLYGKLFVTFFAPLAHEGMIRIQRVIENTRKPLFVSDDEGIAVLDVLNNSNGFSCGLRSGDKIIEINDVKMLSEKQVYEMVRDQVGSLKIKIKSKKQEIKELTLNRDRSLGFGVVLVPKIIGENKVMKFNQNNFKDILDNVIDKKEDDE